MGKKEKVETESKEKVETEKERESKEELETEKEIENIETESKEELETETNTNDISVRSVSSEYAKRELEDSGIKLENLEVKIEEDQIELSGEETIQENESDFNECQSEETDSEQSDETDSERSDQTNSERPDETDSKGSDEIKNIVDQQHRAPYSKNSLEPIKQTSFDKIFDDKIVEQNPIKNEENFLNIDGTNSNTDSSDRTQETGVISNDDKQKHDKNNSDYKLFNIQDSVIRNQVGTKKVENFNYKDGSSIETEDRIRSNINNEGANDLQSERNIESKTNIQIEIITESQNSKSSIDISQESHENTKLDPSTMTRQNSNLTKAVFIQCSKCSFNAKHLIELALHYKNCFQNSPLGNLNLSLNVQNQQNMMSHLAKTSGNVNVCSKVLEGEANQNHPNMKRHLSLSEIENDSIKMKFRHSESNPNEKTLKNESQIFSDESETILNKKTNRDDKKKFKNKNKNPEILKDVKCSRCSFGASNNFALAFHFMKCREQQTITNVEKN